MATKQDIYSEITNQIIEDIESNNILPWENPWNVSFGIPQNAVTGKFYSGLNILILWAMQSKKKYTSSKWVTYKQATSLGGQVRKGEKSTRIIFYQPLKIEEKNDRGEDEEKTIPLMRTYSVFNICQCDGLEDIVKADSLVFNQETEFQALNAAEEILSATKANVQYDGVAAVYLPSTDTIHLPERSSFKGQREFYATALHELTHWTGHESRLNRKLDCKFGSEDYAFEELTAELGASFLCASVGLAYSTQHASYVASWLKALKDDKRFIFKAASKARKALEYVLKLAGKDHSNLESQETK